MTGNKEAILIEVFMAAFNSKWLTLSVTVAAVTLAAYRGILFLCRNQFNFVIWGTYCEYVDIYTHESDKV